MINKTYNLNYYYGTFNKDKIKNKKLKERKGYYLNTDYELVECNQ